MTTAARVPFGLDPAAYADARAHLCPLSSKLGFAAKEDADRMASVLRTQPGAVGWKRRLKTNTFCCVHCGRWHVGRTLDNRLGRRH